MGFPCAALIKNLPASTGDAASIPGSGRAFEVGNGNPLHYSCLENSVGRGAWCATVHRVTQSRTHLSVHTHLGQGNAVHYSVYVLY